MATALNSCADGVVMLLRTLVRKGFSGRFAGRMSTAPTNAKRIATMTMRYFSRSSVTPQRRGGARRLGFAGSSPRR